MSKAKDLQDELDVLDAERMVLTVQLRNDLLREATALLPLAIRQAKGRPARAAQPAKGNRGPRAAQPAKPGSPALLRLISRLAMRPTQIDKVTK